MNKNYEEKTLALGTTIDEAVDQLLHYKYKGKLVSIKFNDKMLYSDTVTMEDAYLQVTGMTKDEFKKHTS